MDNVFRIILCIHIAVGAVALVIAPLAMVTSKGGLWHRRWGKTYFWAMAGVSVLFTSLKPGFVPRLPIITTS